MVVALTPATPATPPEPTTTVEAINALTTQVARLIDLLTRPTIVMDGGVCAPEAPPPAMPGAPSGSPVPITYAEGEPCPLKGCDGKMTLKEGKWGNFWACINWKKDGGCKFTKKIIERAS